MPVAGTFINLAIGFVHHLGRLIPFKVTKWKWQRPSYTQTTRKDPAGEYVGTYIMYIYDYICVFTHTNTYNISILCIPVYGNITKNDWIIPNVCVYVHIYIYNYIHTHAALCNILTTHSSPVDVIGISVRPLGAGGTSQRCRVWLMPKSQWSWSHANWGLSQQKNRFKQQKWNLIWSMCLLSAIMGIH